MVLGLGLLGLRTALATLRGSGAATKAAVQTVPAKTAGWGAYVKTGIVGGSVAAGGLGLSTAIDSAEESIQEGGAGLLMVGGVIVAIILFLFLILRGK